MKSKFAASNLATTVISTNDQILEQPFNITFTWKKESIKIELKKGEDLFKIARLLSIFLTKNKIDHRLSNEK
jgi:hypothetical protein